MAVELSLCMIVKNEEGCLADCLDSVCGVVDEINIVDTGSTDKTVEIASRYTDRIFHFDWINDFSAARNFSFSKATKEYIMWLDADDIITPENAQKILVMKKNLTPDIQYVTMDYQYVLDEYGNPTYTNFRERVVRRDAGFQWRLPVHEALDVSGEGRSTDIFVKHVHANVGKSFPRNFDILEKQVQGGNRDPKMLYYYAINLYDLQRYDDCVTYAEEFITLNKEEGRRVCLPEIYLEAHRIYCMRQDYANALRVLAEAKEILDSSSEFYYELGSFYKNVQNDCNSAADCFSKALTRKVEPKGVIYEQQYYFSLHFALANCYVAMQRYGEALLYFEKALQYDKNNKEVLQMLVKLEQLLRLTQTLQKGM